mgnify:CR=1 FL=1
MPADYKSRATRKKKKSLPGFVWLLSGLAIGLFVAFIVYLDKQPENSQDFGSAVQQELKKLKQQAKKKNASTSTKTSTSTKKQQKFNFYTILPELEVLIPESETRPPETQHQATRNHTKKPGTNKPYILQVR